MAAPPVAIDTSALQAIQGVAGHDGILSNEAGELIVKPCTQSEIDFYETTLATRPEFAEYMPVYMGTLTLGSPDGVIAAVDTEQITDSVPKAQGKKIATSTAIVLENLEHGFIRPNVIDLKLGSKLYAPGTSEEKAARLDKVASETTSGSLNFRIAGMKVWNNKSQTYDLYDKQYGRKFNKDNVQIAFRQYFESLLEEPAIASQFISTMCEEITGLLDILTADESRFFSSSVLIVYEGDLDVLTQRLAAPGPTRQVHAKPSAELDDEDEYEDEEDEEDEDEEPQPTWRLKMIDFAHSQWEPGAGTDENVTIGLESIERQLQGIVAQLQE